MPYSAALKLSFDDADVATMTEAKRDFRMYSESTLHTNGMIRKPSPVNQAVCSPTTGSFKLMTFRQCTGDHCGSIIFTSFWMKVSTTENTPVSSTPADVVLLFKCAFLSIYGTLDDSIMEQGVIQASLVVTNDANICSFEMHIPLAAWFHLVVDYRRSAGSFIVYMNSQQAFRLADTPCSDVDRSLYPDPEILLGNDAGVEVCVDQISYHDEDTHYTPLQVAIKHFYNGK